MRLSALVARNAFDCRRESAEKRTARRPLPSSFEPLRGTQLPLLREWPPRLLDGCDRVRVDHAAVILGHLTSVPRSFSSHGQRHCRRRIPRRASASHTVRRLSIAEPSVRLVRLARSTPADTAARYCAPRPTPGNVQPTPRLTSLRIMATNSPRSLVPPESEVPDLSSRAPFDSPPGVRISVAMGSMSLWPTAGPRRARGRSRSGRAPRDTARWPRARAAVGVERPAHAAGDSLLRFKRNP